MRYLLFLLFLVVGSTLSAQNLLLKNATIIDGNANTPVRKSSILIRDGKIVKVAKNIPEKSKVKIIDCQGKYVTPGLIDAHVHLGTMNLADIRKAHATIDSMVYFMINHGITTVRDMAGNAPFLRSYKEAFIEGAPIPEIFYAAQFAGPSYFKLYSAGNHDRAFGIYPWERIITDTTNIEQAVIEAKNEGVSGIKIYADLSSKMVHEITKYAHKYGLMAWAHAGVFPIKPSVVADAGVNSMSHANDIVFQQLPGDSLDPGKAWGVLYKGLKADFSKIDPVLKTMKKKGIVLDATLYSENQNNMINGVLIAKRAYDLGLTIDAGTDWFYPRKGNDVPLLDELLILHNEIGMSVREVIQAVTKTNAQVIGLDDRGIIKPGKRADLLILSKNPLDNLRNLFTPSKVIQGGKVR